MYKITCTQHRLLFGCCFQSLFMGIATIGPAQMLQSIIGTPTWLNILIMLSVCTIYTSVVRSVFTIYTSVVRSVCTTYTSVVLVSCFLFNVVLPEI